MKFVAKRSLGLVQIPLLIALLLMAIAIPVATNLVQQNQQNQGRAANVDAACKVCVGPVCNSIYSPPRCDHQFDECSYNGNCTGAATVFPTKKPDPTSSWTCTGPGGGCSSPSQCCSSAQYCNAGVCSVNKPDDGCTNNTQKCKSDSVFQNCENHVWKDYNCGTGKKCEGAGICKEVPTACSSYNSVSNCPASACIWAGSLCVPKGGPTAVPTFSPVNCYCYGNASCTTLTDCNWWHDDNVLPANHVVKCEDSKCTSVKPTAGPYPTSVYGQSCTIVGCPGDNQECVDGQCVVSKIWPILPTLTVTPGSGGGTNPTVTPVPTSSTGGSCHEECPGTTNTNGRNQSDLKNCTPPDTDGTPKENICSQAGVVGQCGSKSYCCPSVDGTWTTDMTYCPVAVLPTNLKQTCSADGKTATFSWDKVSGVNNYVLRVNDSRDNKWMGPGDLWLMETASPVSIGITLGEVYSDWSVQSYDPTYKIGYGRTNAVGFTCKASAQCTRNSSAKPTDFSDWKKELKDGGFGTIKSVIWKTDFNCDGYVTLVDYSIWREAYIKSLGL